MKEMLFQNFFGLITGSLGGDNPYEDIKLTPDEVNQLNQLYDVVSDEHTYPKINRSIVKDDIPLIKKVMDMCNNNNLFDDEWDLIDTYEKITM